MATIEERASKYEQSHPNHTYGYCDYFNGAKDQRKIDIEEVSEWLDANWRKYIDQDADGVIRFAGWKNDFKNAMKL